jgi:D-alanyl-D-alanine carboxypeptidase
MIENKLMKRIFAFLLIILFGVSAMSVKGQTIDPGSVTELLENLKEDSGVKSLLAGIREGEREILTITMGESMTDYPATVEMHIRIGGISETFLGTLLMILNERNLISLDDRVSKWLPDFLAADEVTLDMLIKNTAGYKDYVYNDEFIELVMSHPFRHISREEIFQYSTSGGSMNFPPGTSQKYSHTEFTILGVILELATGKSMSELYEEYIFQPLDLRRTGYSENAFLPIPVLHSFSSDRDIYEDATYWSPS